MLLFCSSICRMPTPPCTKRNNGTRQEHADNNRIVRKINANKNAKQTRNSDREFANCIMQSAGPSANLQIRGRRCSRRMAHSDPPPPSRRAGLEACQIPSARTSADYKASDGPRPTRRLHLKIPEFLTKANPQTPNLRFWTDFLPIENSLKI